MADRRNTVQKGIILESIRQIGGHQTADAVYDHVHVNYPTISKATVYRNLNQMTELGDLKKVQLPDGADVFDLRTNPHYHIRCSVCKRVFDVELPYMQDLNTKIRDTHGFVISGHNIVFSGICPECIANEPNKGEEQEHE